MTVVVAVVCTIALVFHFCFFRVLLVVRQQHGLIEGTPCKTLRNNHTVATVATACVIAVSARALSDRGPYGNTPVVVPVVIECNRDVDTIVSIPIIFAARPVLVVATPLALQTRGTVVVVCVPAAVFAVIRGVGKCGGTCVLAVAVGVSSSGGLLRRSGALALGQHERHHAVATPHRCCCKRSLHGVVLPDVNVATYKC